MRRSRPEVTRRDVAERRVAEHERDLAVGSDREDERLVLARIGRHPHLAVVDRPPQRLDDLATEAAKKEKRFRQSQANVQAVVDKMAAERGKPASR